MAGTLFVVATPIGHLEDITLRALRVLREVTVIAAEDTRRTSRLLNHYAIGARLVSLHEHNERRRIPQILASLRAGASVALVSDAGTPGASDPGMLLVAAARDAGIRVTAVPGASAITAALSVTGVPADRFVFEGFPPVRSKERVQWFSSIPAHPHTVVFFEAPHRIRRTLVDLAQYLGERPIMLARELTKLHEEVLTGSPAQLLDRLSSPRGEFTVVIPPPPLREKTAGGEGAERQVDQIRACIGQLTELPRSKRDIARSVAAELGLSVREVYKVLVQLRDNSVK
jgi:16S rRNA (cytidine1402-2'-O)-methyltransferase